jgi:co-chaperonin GroES (HSP10)|tara:strand:+ start:461 stop:727 length:267 start_codon:yes stop_codon:yes gene_type:complete
MAIQMLGDQVLVEAAPKEERKAGSIILSADVKQTSSEPGVVVAAGPDADQALVKGATVYMDWNKSLPVNIGGNAAVIISNEHIKAVIS